MKLLLGSLLLAGVCWLGAAIVLTPMPNFNSRKISGDWRPLANIVIEREFPQFALMSIPSGGLSYSYKYLANGRCNTRSFQFAQQGPAGKFRAASYEIVHILDTDYKTYIISYIKHGMDSYLTLAGKAETMPANLETKFKQIASAAGVTGNVVPVGRTATC